MTEIQITNRGVRSSQRVTATLCERSDDSPIMEFVLRPGEAVIIPLQDGMNLRVAEMADTGYGRANGLEAPVREAGGGRWSGRLP